MYRGLCVKTRVVGRERASTRYKLKKGFPNTAKPFRRALESTDLGARNSGSDIRIEPFGNNLIGFEIVGIGLESCLYWYWQTKIIFGIFCVVAFCSSKEENWFERLVSSLVYNLQRAFSANTTRRFKLEGVGKPART